MWNVMADHPESDAALWQRARSGDERAFGDLFVRHVQRVYNYCFRRLGSWSLAEEAAQLVFIHTWVKRDAVLVEDSMLPFLFAVANNVVRNLARSTRRYATASAGLPPREPVSDHADDVAKRIDEERQMRQVLDAMRKMRRSDQEVLAMCDWEGVSHLEVASALKVPVGTVKSRLSRARHRLRNLVADVDQLVQTEPSLRIERAPGESEGELL
jgi:RNA polymerase sigma factor (sigma-70 family)